MKPVKQTCSRSDVISTLLGNIALQRDAAPVCLHNGRSWLFMLGVCYASISALQLADRHRLFCPKQGPSTSKLDWRVSDQKAAKELANIIRQLRVGTRRATFQIHRRKAALEVSLPGSRHSSLSAGDPKRPSRFPDSGRSAKPGAFELEFSEPAIGDLNLPAMTRQSTMPRS